MKHLTLTLALFTSFSAFAIESTADKIACKSQSWAKRTLKTFEDVQMVVLKTPRSEVVQMAWGEVVSNPPDSYAIPLLKYLASTESVPARAEYFESIGKKLTKNQSLDELVFQWPKTPALAKTDLKLKTLCKTYPQK